MSKDDDNPLKGMTTRDVEDVLGDIRGIASGRIERTKEWIRESSTKDARRWEDHELLMMLSALRSMVAAEPVLAIDHIYCIDLAALEAELERRGKAMVYQNARAYLAAKATNDRGNHR